jgi:hypothetical protein
MAISVFVALIYTLRDYKYNDYLGAFLGDLTLLLMIMAIFISLFSSLLLFFTTFKKVKNSQK